MNFKLINAHIIFLINMYLIVASQAEDNLVSSSFKQNRPSRKHKSKTSSYNSIDDGYFSSFISNKNTFSAANRNLNKQKFSVFAEEASNGGTGLSVDCPAECSCAGLAIDCSYRELKQVPKNIPKNVIKV